MKSCLLSFAFVLVSLVAVGQALPLDSFYAPGTTWTHTSGYQYCTNSSYSYYITHYRYGSKYRVEKDTLIGGTSYYLLQCGRTAVVRWDSGTYSHDMTFNAITAPLKRFARLRVSGEKVYITVDSVLETAKPYYYYFYTPGTEYLLYDFSVKPGDTVYNLFALSSFMAGATHDSVRLSDGSYSISVPRAAGGEKWIRGIGSTQAFIDEKSILAYPGSPFQQEGTFASLCYENPHFSYKFTVDPSALPDNLEQTCFDLSKLAVGGVSVEEAELTVFPNPVAQGQPLRIKGAAAKSIEQVVIRDVAGRIVFSEDHPFRSTDELSAWLSPGLYTLMALNGNTTRIYKLLVQD